MPPASDRRIIDSDENREVTRKESQMVAVLDSYARQEAQSLIDRYGDLALARAQERAQDAATRGDAILVGLWEIIAFNIRSMSANA